MLFVITAPLFARVAEFAFPQEEVERGWRVDEGSILTHIRQLGVPDLTKRERERVIDWLFLARAGATAKFYEALRNPNPLVRSGVLEVFTRAYMEGAWRELRGPYEMEKDKGVKIVYVKGISKSGVQELVVVEDFIRGLQKEKDDEIVDEIIAGLKFVVCEKKPGPPLSEDDSEMLKTMAGTAFLEKLRDPNTKGLTKCHLIMALGELKEIRALSYFASLVLDPAETGVDDLLYKRTTMRALKMIGTLEAMQILFYCLDYSKLEETAVELLPSFGVRALDDWVIVLNGKSRSSFARCGAADAIGEITDFGKDLEKVDNIEKAGKALEAAQDDSDENVKEKVEEALEKLVEKGFKRKSFGGNEKILVVRTKPSSPSAVPSGALVRVGTVKTSPGNPLWGWAQLLFGGLAVFGEGLQKYDNIEKTYQTLDAAEKGLDRYVADKARKALKRLKENGVKRDSEHLVF